MKSASDIVMKLLGVLLLTAAVLTGCQPSSESAANDDKEPTQSTTSYEVLEPETWVGERLPILKDIDISKQLKKGAWLVLFYHYDCSECVTAIKEYKSYAADLAGNGDLLKIAFIEVPPYGKSVVRNNPNYVVGKLLDIKEWFIATPAVVLLEDNKVRNSWEQEVPDFDTILEKNVSTKLLMPSL
jgi:hypothetical protein